MTIADMPFPHPLKILTYNVHRCIGADRKLDPGRIAAVIAETGADIIGLQELDVGRRRTGGVDQAHDIASRLRMDAHFHPAMNVGQEQYGDAILTSLPMRLIKADALPSIGEPRGAILVEIMVGETPVQLLNTHLGLRRGERLLQVATLMGPEWLDHPACAGKHRILIGDFNSLPSSLAYRNLASRLNDTHYRGSRHTPTFPSRYPFFRLDYIFISAGLACNKAQVISGPQTRVASDHLPLLAHVEIRHAAQRDGTKSNS